MASATGRGWEASTNAAKWRLAGSSSNWARTPAQPVGAAAAGGGGPWPVGLAAGQPGQGARAGQEPGAPQQGPAVELLHGLLQQVTTTSC